jgi:hypothetical protein
LALLAWAAARAAGVVVAVVAVVAVVGDVAAGGTGRLTAKLEPVTTVT